MKQGEVKRIFFGVVSEYFKAAEVAWSKQNLSVKSKEPFVRLTAGNLKRSRFPAVSVIDGVPVNAYKCSFPIVVDLFTNGAEVPGSEQTENTAVQDLSSFVDFLDSEYVTDRCFAHGVTILFDPTDLCRPEPLQALWCMCAGLLGRSADNDRQRADSAAASCRTEKRP